MPSDLHMRHAAEALQDKDILQGFRQLQDDLLQQQGFGLIGRGASFRPSLQHIQTDSALIALAASLVQAEVDCDAGDQSLRRSYRRDGAIPARS